MNKSLLLRVSKRIELKGAHRVFVLPDLHCPWHDEEALKVIYQDIKKYKPTIVVQLGDALDLYSFSKYARSHNLLTPDEELKKGKKDLEKMWAKIRSIAPRARCFQLLGNHELRAVKRLYETCPALESLFSMDDVFAYKGVTVLKNEHDELVIDGVHYIHGYLSGVGGHLRKLGVNIVSGHSHRPYVHWENLQGGSKFELNAGYLGDPSAPVFKYGMANKHNWLRAYGTVDRDKGPQVVILEKYQ